MSQPSYPISGDVFTTLDRTIVPGEVPATAAKIYPYEVARYAANGYGTWAYGPGVPSIERLDLMPSTYAGTSVTADGRLLNFFAMSDIHITDEETPAGAVFMGFRGGTSGGYSPVMPYTTQVLDAAVQTVNAMNKKDAFSFGISLGDATNNGQYNELRWYIDTMDGKLVSPDSGVKDDPIPGPLNDYQDPFQAAGLDPSIPWYQTVGNHDHLWIGTGPQTPRICTALVGDTMLEIGNPYADPLGEDSHGYYVGSLDGRTPLADVFGAGPVAAFKSPPTVPAADPDRKAITSTTEFMKQFFTTSSTPVGHGFTQANLDSGSASYSFVPSSSVPVKVIDLDDTDSVLTPNIDGGRPMLDAARYQWLIGELDKGQAAGQLMIIAAHIPIGVSKPGSFMDWNPASAVTENDLIAKLHTYPNLLAWISGHRHINAVTPFPSPDAGHPELGFWEIETASLRDAPQEFRTFQIERNSDNTVSIVTTDVDPAVADGSIAAISRTDGIAASEVFNNPNPYPPTGAYNATLVKQLSPQMQTVLAGLGLPASR